MGLKNNLRVGFFLALNYIKRGKKRTTILTIFLMSMVVFNLVFIPSIISGISNTFAQNAIDYSYGHIFIGPAEDKQYIDNVDSLLKKINQLPWVVGASPRYNMGATISYKNKSVGINVNGIIPSEEMQVSRFHEKIESGDYVSKNPQKEIFLGRAIAGEEGKGDLADSLGGVRVGEEVTLAYGNGVIEEYKISGIYSAGSEIVDWFALTNIKEIERVLNQSNKASAVVIKINNPGNEAKYKAELKQLGIKEDIKTWQEKMQNVIEEIVSSFDLLNFVTIIISIIIAAIVLFIVIYIHTVNKKRQIGILKALGISKDSIIYSYIFESIFYVILGIIFGSIILFISILYLHYNPLPFPMGDLYPSIEAPIIIIGLIFLFITAVLSGFLPSWRIVKQSILEGIWGQ